jgi:predicted AAA+ superfamily ATPase
LRENPVCALLGPRQCGKSTLARMVAGPEAHWFDLETESGRAALEHPELVLSPLRGLVVIDEIQLRPELFSVLRPMADRSGTPARFLILGSASPGIVGGVSESLAGRVGFVDLGGLDLGETGVESMERLWLRGGFPRSFLAASETASLRWRRDFIRTFLERDLPRLGIRTPSETLRRFWTMVAHYHGQVWNGAELSRSLGISQSSVRHYVDVLCGAYLVRRLMPWHTNLGKREVKAPKIYVRDSGILHSLLAMRNRESLFSNPKLGASWEGFCVEQALSLFGADETYFWATHNGAEIDLVVFRNGKAWGIDVKMSDAPRMTKSLHVALHDLGLERAWILYPGTRRYPVHERVEALPLSELPSLAEFLEEDQENATN